MPALRPRSTPIFVGDINAVNVILVRGGIDVAASSATDANGNRETGERGGRGGEEGVRELVAARIKSSHLIKLLWAGSLFPRRIGVSCNEVPPCASALLRDLHDEDLEESWLRLLACLLPRNWGEDRSREGARGEFVVNSHSFVCQQLEKLVYEFLLELGLILTFDELLSGRGGWLGLK